MHMLTFVEFSNIFFVFKILDAVDDMSIFGKNSLFFSFFSFDS